MAQKAKCLTRKIKSPKFKSEKEPLAQVVRMKNVRRNIKIRCVGEIHGEKLSRNWNS